MPANEKNNSINVPFPMTSMNFIVTAGTGGAAAFSEITGIEASVDVIEFRQGNSPSLTPVKIPGLVHHGNITMKYGMVLDAAFRQWVMKCVTSHRAGVQQDFRQDVRIELINTQEKGVLTTLNDQAAAAAAANSVWVLKDAWVTKYTGPDMNAMNSEIAVESVEIAYEELIIAGNTQA